MRGVVSGVTSVYVGDPYELELDGAVQTTRLYYAAAGQRVAVRTNGSHRQRAFRVLLPLTSAESVAYTKRMRSPAGTAGNGCLRQIEAA